jgi:hypothetical protein
MTFQFKLAAFACAGVPVPIYNDGSFRRSGASTPQDCSRRWGRRETGSSFNNRSRDPRPGIGSATFSPRRYLQ